MFLNKCPKIMCLGGGGCLERGCVCRGGGGGLALTYSAGYFTLLSIVQGHLRTNHTLTVSAANQVETQATKTQVKKLAHSSTRNTINSKHNHYYDAQQHIFPCLYLFIPLASTTKTMAEMPGSGRSMSGHIRTFSRL